MKVEKESIRKENEVMISSLADILFNQKINTIDNYHYVNRVYNIIKALKNNKRNTFQEIDWFKKYNIHDKEIQTKIVIKLMEKIIFSLAEILFNCSIETMDPNNDYQTNQMYDIIKALKNHESYDMIYWFEENNINDKKSKNLNNLLKIKEFCYRVENDIFNKKNTDKDELMNDLLISKTLYLSAYKSDNNKFEFVTRLVVPNPYWESIIETSDDYKEYFEELICPKSMSFIEKCNCKTCCYITEKIKSLD